MLDHNDVGQVGGAHAPSPELLEQAFVVPAVHQPRLVLPDEMLEPDHQHARCAALARHLEPRLSRLADHSRDALLGRVAQASLVRAVLPFDVDGVSSPSDPLDVMSDAAMPIDRDDAPSARLYESSGKHNRSDSGRQLSFNVSLLTVFALQLVVDEGRVNAISRTAIPVQW